MDDDEYANDAITDDDKPGIPEPVDPAEAEEDTEE